MKKDELAKQFNGCTSNCGSICDYIVDLTDAEFENTIISLQFIGASMAANSLIESKADRIKVIKALADHKDESSDNTKYFEIKKRIDSRGYENEEWERWYK